MKSGRRNAWKLLQLSDGEEQVHGDSYNFLKNFNLKYKQFSICKSVKIQTDFEKRHWYGSGEDIRTLAGSHYQEPQHCEMVNCPPEVFLQLLGERATGHGIKNNLENCNSKYWQISSQLEKVKCKWNIVDRLWYKRLRQE